MPLHNDYIIGRGSGKTPEKKSRFESQKSCFPRRKQHFRTHLGVSERLIFMYNHQIDEVIFFSLPETFFSLKKKSRRQKKVPLW